MTMKYFPDLTISSGICSKEEIIEVIHDREIISGLLCVSDLHTDAYGSGL